ncbi:MAG: class I SAM-dependent methyltransferase family protein [Candidatus Aenigmarchaeota archaeon]|nr:class I SAM-dependent methyltransferase family protein [Candidatus Aenigmarchaeota archaeon]
MEFCYKISYSKLAKGFRGKLQSNVALQRDRCSAYLAAKLQDFNRQSFSVIDSEAKVMGLKEELEGKIPESKLAFLRTGFDIIGDVAVIEIPEELESKKLIIAKALAKVQPHIKTVCRKLGEREGTFRLRELEILVGKDTRTEHRECGCAYRLDLARVYFSPREATERQRIALQVRPKETVMVMFAGVGPYAIMIAKKQKPARVYAIEINPDAFKYMKENIRINKVSDKVEPVLGDVKKVARNFYGKCDRVVMPLPKEGYKFLPYAFRCLKTKGGIIHFYHYAHEDDLYSEAEGLVKKAAKKAGRSIKILARRKVLPYGPRVFKVCLDIKAGKSK